MGIRMIEMVQNILCGVTRKLAMQRPIAMKCQVGILLSRVLLLQKLSYLYQEIYSLRLVSDAATQERTQLP